MSRRLLAEARQALEDLLPSVSDYHANRYRQSLKAAEQEAARLASQHVQAQAKVVQKARTSALQSLTETRDAFQELVRLGSLGRISSADYQARLADLKSEQQNAEAVLDRAQAEVELISAIEADPIQWFDSLAQRFPNMKLEVGF